MPCKICDTTENYPKWIGRAEPVPWPAWSTGHSPLGFFVWCIMKQKVSSSPMNSEGKLRNRIETAAKLVWDKLLSLKVTVRAIRKLAVGRALETQADKLKTSKNCSCLCIFKINILCIPYNLLIIVFLCMSYNLYCSRTGLITKWFYKILCNYYFLYFKLKTS